MVKKSNQTGFTIPEILLVVLTLVIIAVAGYFVAKHINKSNSPSSTTSSSIKSNTASTNASSATPQATYSTINNTKYLIIKEWNVKLALTAPIDSATYTLVTNNTYISPAVFLSTAMLNASESCVNYYKQGVVANDPTPSYQDIQQLTLSQDTTDMIGGGATITAQQASTQSPSTFIKVGNYVYYFSHGNGMPCPEQASDILPAFETAYSTISAAD